MLVLVLVHQKFVHSVDNKHATCFDMAVSDWVSNYFLSVLSYQFAANRGPIKCGKHSRKLKDEFDDFDVDDVVQPCLFLFLFMPLKFVTCTYHSTAFWRSLIIIITHSLHFFHIITYQHSYFFGTQVHTP